MSAASTRLRLADLQGAIRTRLEQAADAYRREVAAQLTGQHRVQLLQRCLLITVERIYADTLHELDVLDVGDQARAVVDGRSALTPLVLSPFQGFTARLLEQALRFNAGSCVLSNFPTEQRPAADYLDDIKRDLAAAWRGFALEVNYRLLPVVA